MSIGDSVTRYVSYDEHDTETHLAYEGVFASELAKLFFYTGSVRDIAPREGHPAKPDASAGPEITIENMGLGGRVSAHALARVTTDAFDNGVGILTLSYGINDAFAQEGLTDFLRPFREATEIAKAKGSDVFFIGPSTILNPAAHLEDMARTRHYSSALESLAAELGVFFFDFASITTRGPGIAPDTPDEKAIEAYNGHLAKAYHTHKDGIVDLLHPSATAHRLAGEALYKELLVPGQPRYRAGGIVTLDGKGGCRLEFKVKNLTDLPVEGRVFTPSFLSFKAAQTSIPFSFKAGKGQTLIANYATADGSDIYALDGSEPFLRVPLLIGDEVETLSYVVAGEIHPFAPIWQLGDIDGLTTETPIEFKLHGAAGAEVEGEFTASWGGASESGRFSTAAPAPFKLPLPASRSVRFKSPLTLALKPSSGGTYRFRRGLEVSRNLGLEQAVPMARVDRYDQEGGGRRRRGRHLPRRRDAGLLDPGVRDRLADPET